MNDKDIYDWYGKQMIKLAINKSTPVNENSGYTNSDPSNVGLRERSGAIDINSKLVAFLYVLIRDHFPAGDIETLVRDSQEPDCYYTNGWLAKYAEDLANRLK